MNAPANIARSTREPVAPQAGRYKLRVADYMLLDDAGAFDGGETELVDGWVNVMRPEWIPHMRIKDELSFRLRSTIDRLGLALVTGTSGSIDISETDQPRPDIIIASAFVGDRAVRREDLLLLVEVSSSTLSFDLGEKAATYAHAEVPEYWVADVNGRVIHRMWSPSEGQYGKRDQIEFGQELAAITITGLKIATDGL